MFLSPVVDLLSVLSLRIAVPLRRVLTLILVTPGANREAGRVRGQVRTRIRRGVGREGAGGPIRPWGRSRLRVQVLGSVEGEEGRGILVFLSRSRSRTVGPGVVFAGEVVVEAEMKKEVGIGLEGGWRTV